MKLVLLGAPGAGKGTQAKVISDAMSIPTISTGNILREAVSAGTVMGQLAKEHIERGQLVPDDVVIGIIKERLKESDCAAGFIFDGFPRTIPQAEALFKLGINLDKVISLEVEDEKIVRRMSGRRICPSCGNSYHIEYNRPSVEGKCDNCGDKLIIRTDDTPETVLQRLEIYHKQTEPLKSFYKDKGILVMIDGSKNVTEISELILSVLRQNL